MCGRYTLGAGKAEWEFADVRIEWQGPRRFNIAPSQRAPIVRMEAGLPVLRDLRWGLIPFWAKDAKIGNTLANARSETIATKPSFRAAFQKRRCVVFADGYYEWQSLGKLKQPWRFVRPDRQTMLLAGLWESWRNAAAPGDPLETFTLITTEPNAVASAVHDRMPVILSGDAVNHWLAETTTPESLTALMRPCPDSDLQRYAVSPLVGNPRNDIPQCIEPLPPELL